MWNGGVPFVSHGGYRKDLARPACRGPKAFTSPSLRPHSHRPRPSQPPLSRAGHPLRPWSRPSSLKFQLLSSRAVWPHTAQLPSLPPAAPLPQGCGEEWLRGGQQALASGPAGRVGERCYFYVVCTAHAPCKTRSQSLLG